MLVRTRTHVLIQNARTRAAGTMHKTYAGPPRPRPVPEAPGAGRAAHQGDPPRAAPGRPGLEVRPRCRGGPPALRSRSPVRRTGPRQRDERKAKRPLARLAAARLRSHGLQLAALAPAQQPFS